METIKTGAGSLEAAAPRGQAALDSAEHAGHPRRRAVLAVMCLSLLIVVIDNTILNTALPTLARVLKASTTDLQWITDAYTLAFAALLIMAGALGDRFGRRRALIAGLAVFAAGSAWAAVSGDSSTLIAARAVMGIGAAFVMPATLSIITAVFPARERAGAIGAWSAIAGVGIVVGPTLGGLLLAHFYWGSVFWVNVPLARCRPRRRQHRGAAPARPPQLRHQAGRSRRRAVRRRDARGHRRRDRGPEPRLDVPHDARRARDRRRPDRGLHLPRTAHRQPAHRRARLPPPRVLGR